MDPINDGSASLFLSLPLARSLSPHARTRRHCILNVIKTLSRRSKKGDSFLSCFIHIFRHMSGIKRKAELQVPITDENDLLKITPLGSGNEVGRSSILLEYKGKTVLVGCKFFSFLQLIITLWIWQVRHPARQLEIDMCVVFSKIKCDLLYNVIIICICKCLIHVEWFIDSLLFFLSFLKL